jgi:vacuolar-type H+-ATPase subunit D/Vma8
MTDQEKNLLINFKGKLTMLMTKHESLKLERDQLQQNIGEMEVLINQMRHDYKALEQKYENLKIAKMLVASADENKDAKGKIQKIVREIDKCIALLNK